MSYLVLFKLVRKTRLSIGSLGRISFKRGYYLYVGSAPAKWISKRIERHATKEKKLRWHIDYFSNNRFVSFLDYKITEFKECSLARKLNKRFTYIASFGSSDCNCPSHLFYSNSSKLSSLENLTFLENKESAKGQKAFKRRSKELESYFMSKEKEFEALCIRCGSCCGAYDGDPCLHLKKDKDNKYYCRIYPQRFGERKTISGDDFECVPIREILNDSWIGDYLCAYKNLHRRKLFNV